MKKLLMIALVVIFIVSISAVGLVGCENNDPLDAINYILDKEIGTIWFYRDGKLINEIYLKGEEFGYKSSVGREGYVIRENGALVSYVYSNGTWTKYSDENNVNKLYNVKNSLMSFKSNFSFEKELYIYKGGEYYSENNMVRIFRKDGKVELYKEGELYMQFVTTKPNLVVHQN